jgi:hypothetical protein
MSGKWNASAQARSLEVDVRPVLGLWRALLGEDPGVDRARDCRPHPPEPGKRGGTNNVHFTKYGPKLPEMGHCAVATPCSDSLDSTSLNLAGSVAVRSPAVDREVNPCLL